jgi:hypothetical protein
MVPVPTYSTLVPDLLAVRLAGGSCIFVAFQFSGEQRSELKPFVF